MVQNIYLARHGETNDNVNRIVQGGDSVLSVRGEQQAVVLAERLKTLSFQHLIVSDYIRTRQTVVPLLPHISIVPEYTSLVRETKQPTSLVGISNQSEEFRSYAVQVGDHLSDPTWRFEDEENFFDVIERVQQFFTSLEKRDGDVLVVTHGRFIIYLVMYVLTGGNLTPDVWNTCRHGFETTNTGITHFRFNTQRTEWKLLTFNDQSHFAE